MPDLYPAAAHAACLAAAILLSGCAGHPVERPAAFAPNERSRTHALAVFSANAPGGLPDGWSPLALTRNKKATAYRLVDDDGRTVLHAHAASAASMLMQTVDIDPTDQPWLFWQWRVSSLLERSDNFHPHGEDSPVRIVLAFDGDKSALPFTDQIALETRRLLSGNELPYATLMYIWERQAPVNTVIDNARTGRVKKIVAASGSEGAGTWRRFVRNIVADYRIAFGEMPGRLVGIGVMTDTDNTGETIEAWYGDIHLQKSPG